MFDGLFEFCQLSGGGSVGKSLLFICCSDRHAVLDSNHAVVAPVICVVVNSDLLTVPQPVQ